MILLISASLLGSTGGSETAQPSQGFIVCPGDPRCPAGSQKPPQGFIVCPGDARCPPPVVPAPVYTVCPDGSNVPPGSQCPVLAIAPTLVYFGWDDATLTDEARNLLNQFVESYRRGGAAQIVVAGHADRSGSDAYNVGLSERRAAAVRDYLIAFGLPASAITTEAFGETRPAVETEDGQREPDNRRVEIVAGPGSGW